MTAKMSDFMSSFHLFLFRNTVSRTRPETNANQKYGAGSNGQNTPSSTNCCMVKILIA